jgi:hypothetical protein
VACARVVDDTNLGNKKRIFRKRIETISNTAGIVKGAVRDPGREGRWSSAKTLCPPLDFGQALISDVRRKISGTQYGVISTYHLG